MIAALMICAGLVATPTADDPVSYEQALAEAGRDADSQVRLALWCESHDLPAERLKHLALAVLADPANATARGLMGLVRDAEGRWVKPDQLARKVRDDAERAAALAEYHARRARMQNDAEGHWRLALWCEENRLDAEAQAHLSAVVRLEPRREAAWKRLGCKKVDGRWLTEDQVAVAKSERQAKQRADKQWMQKLEAWKAQLGDGRKSAEAEAGLAGVDDPRAVPSVWKVFVASRSQDQIRAAAILGRIDAPAASRALAALAVFSDSAEVRRVATEHLATRDPREFLGLILAQVRKPIRFEVRPVGGPGSPGALFVEGKRANTLQVFAPPSVTNPMQPGDVVLYDDNGLPVIHRYGGLVEDRAIVSDDYAANVARNLGNLTSQVGKLGLSSNSSPFLGAAGDKLVSVIEGAYANDSTFALAKSAMPGSRALRPVDVQIPIGRMMVEAQRTAANAEAQLEGQVAMLEQANARIAAWNDRVLPLLDNLTGQELGPDPGAWGKWWTEAQGYSYAPTAEQPRPTVIEFVPLSYQPQPIPLSFELGGVVGFRHSCFGAGTPVRTLDGLRPIESIRLGDQVLTQDGSTGRLSFQPVLAAHHNPPNETLRIDLGGESIVATPIHRFWEVGRGWVMARDLKAGDLLRTVDGITRVVAVDGGSTQPVFNLEVASGRSFFVGKGGCLVHDNSVIETVDRPFDSGGEVAHAAGRRP